MTSKIYVLVFVEPRRLCNGDLLGPLFSKRYCCLGLPYHDYSYRYLRARSKSTHYEGLIASSILVDFVICSFRPCALEIVRMLMIVCP